MSSPLRSWHVARAAIQTLLGLGAVGALFAGQVDAPTIVSPKTGFKTQELWLNFKGKAKPLSAVLLYADGQFLTRAEADNQGNWTAEASFVEGSFNVTANYENTDGSMGAPSRPTKIVVDERDILKPLNQKIQIQSPKNGATVRRGTVKVAGISAPGRRIEVTVDGKSFKTTSEEDGSWSFNLFLSPGKRVITFQTAVEPKETVKLNLTVR